MINLQFLRNSRGRRCARILLVVALVSGLMSFTSVRAQLYTEVDAGELLPTAEIVPAGINTIRGRLSTINPLGDIDLYRLTFGETGNLKVSIVVGPPPNPQGWFDSDVTIFNALGNPLSTHDPATFTVPISPGTYYFAIADWDIVATDKSGNWIADDFTNTLVPDGVLGGWQVTSSPVRFGSYDIQLSMTTVPEPSALLLAVLGIVSGAVIRRRRR
jgi:PEP-CTERM motif-containing protein